MCRSSLQDLHASRKLEEFFRFVAQAEKAYRAAIKDLHTALEVRNAVNASCRGHLRIEPSALSNTCTPALLIALLHFLHWDAYMW